MHLKSLQVQFMPGIDSAFTLDDISPGFNVITGPNGSGKSSVRRLTAAMLWPPLQGTGDTRARAVWETRLGLHQVDFGRVINWQLSGKDVNSPDVPDVHLSSCYSLDLRDLLSMQSDVDQHLATRLRIELSAGYDLRAIREAAKQARPAGRKEMQRLGEARRALAALTREREQLAAQEDGLDALNRQRNTARHQSGMKAVFADAISYVTTRAELQQATAKQEGFPEILQRIQGDEHRRLAQLETTASEEAQRLRQQETALSRAEGVVAAARINGQQLDPAGLQACKTRARDLRALEIEISNQQDQVSRQDARRTEAEKAMAVIESGNDAALAPTPELLSVIDVWLKRRSKLLNQKAELDARMELLVRPESPQTDPGVLQTGMAYLRQWLATTNALESFKESNGVFLALVIGFIVGLGLAFGLTPWFVALSGICIGALAGRWGIRGNLHKKRKWVQSSFDQLGIQRPGVWEDSAVHDELEALEIALTEAKERSRSLHLYEELSREREHLGRELKESDEERLQIINKAGFDPNVEDLLLSEMAHRLVEARAAISEHEATLAAQVTDQKRWQKLLNTINTFNAKYDLKPSEDTAEVEAALDEITRRIEQYERGSAEVAHIRDDIAQIQQRIHRLQEERAALCVALAVDPLETESARAQIKQLCDTLPAYRQATEAQKQLMHRNSDLAARLEGHEVHMQDDVETLMQLQADAIAAETTLASLATQIADITAHVKQERSSSRHDEASTEVVRAAESQNAAFDTVVDTVLTDVLLDQIEDDHETGTQPEVFAAASYYFSAFTQGNYELILRDDDGEPRFGARDSDGRYVQLNDLSDGTRIQLLLAARLAFAASEERAETLPIWLDEALTTSDQTRFVAIVEALATLAEEGRQVFYLTSNPVEAKIIQTVSAKRELAQLRILDLGVIRKLATQDEILVSPDEIYAAQVPAPKTLSAEAYAKAVNVPALLPNAALEATHLYHVMFDDLDALYALLQCHVETIGQWCVLASKGQTVVLLDGVPADRLNARIEALRGFLKACQEGRGRPVDERALRDSGAVSDTYLDRLSEIASDSDGDASQFVQTLENKSDDRAKGFRQVQLDALRDYLETHGFMDARRPLTKSEVTASVLATAAVRQGLHAGCLSRNTLLHAMDVWSQPYTFASE
ncbi:MAG: exonuclease SbcC [Candidatus Promineifilaceae bacterium]|jgi:exonuclease SbcC